MSFTFVSATKSNAANPPTISNFVISAGQSIVVIAYDALSSASSLSISDGTNTWVQRGSRTETNSGTVTWLVDCIQPTPGTYTLTLTGGAGSGQQQFVALKYIGLLGYSAGSFIGRDFTGAIPTTTDGFVTSTAVTPTNYPAMVICSAVLPAGGTASTLVGSGFTTRFGPGSDFKICVEDLELTGSGSHVGSFTYSGTPTGPASIIAAAYLTVLDPLIAGITTDLVTYNVNWQYSTAASTNFIQVGTTGASCNNQTGGQEVFASWQAQQFTADQTARVILSSFVSGAQAGPAVRVSNGAAGPNGYVIFFDAAHYNIGKLVNGGFTSLTGGQQARTNNLGDIVILQVSGTTITVFINGTTLTQVTDSTWASGAPGIAFTGVHPSTVLNSFNATSLGIITQPQALTSIIGQIGANVSPPLTHQTLASSSTSGTLGVGLAAPATPGQFSLSASFIEGQLLNTLSIFGQTASFAEGVLTTSITGGASLSLGPQTGGFVVGQLFDNISYILDQGTITLVGQTSTFVQGVMSAVVNPQLTALSSPGTVGIPTPALTLLTATAQTLASSEGVLVANLGNNVTTALLAQILASSEGALSGTIGYVPTAETSTFVVGTLTFSTSGTFTTQLGGQIGTFTEGLMVLTFAPGSGYPNLAGLLLEEATERLELAGAVVPASIGYFGTWPVSAIWVPSQVPPFVVLAQSIVPGAPIVANAPITLTVSQPNESVAYP